MKNIFSQYSQLPKPILQLISAELLLNLINGAFMLILNIYLRKLGYSDEMIASYTSYRFMGILLFALPFGLFIKGKKLKPFFLIASMLIPISSILLLQTVRFELHLLAKISFFIWGIGMMLLQVSILPFIMRNCTKEFIPEAISLNFATWSFSMIISGALIALFRKISEINIGNYTLHLSEYFILMMIIFISIFSIFLILPLNEGPPRTKSSRSFSHFLIQLSDYDWHIIIKVLVPTLLIAVGAGLTIPFINLFFFSIFGMDSDKFSIIGSFSAGLVFISALSVPFIKRKFGYKISILSTQSAAIMFLVILAITELLAQFPGVIYIAIFCFIIRQPLMNMSGPLISELVMNYVGEKNQELISAIHSSVWSASWFISAKIFQHLRGINMGYYKIFIITAFLYTIGVFLYYLVIRDYEQRSKN